MVSSLFAPMNASQAALMVSPDGCGHVTASPRANFYTLGANVTLTATPDAGQTFVGWTGDASGTSSPLAITMDQSKVIVGAFTRRPTLIATASLNGAGDEGFHFTLCGEAGALSRIDTSTNLLDWDAFAICTNYCGQTPLNDPAGTAEACRFYRAVALP